MSVFQPIKPFFLKNAVKKTQFWTFKCSFYEVEKISGVYFSLIDFSGVSISSYFQVSALKTRKFSRNFEKSLFFEKMFNFLRGCFFQNFKKHSLNSEKNLGFTYRSDSSDVAKKNWPLVAFI